MNLVRQLAAGLLLIVGGCQDGLYLFVRTAGE